MCLKMGSPGFSSQRSPLQPTQLPRTCHVNSVYTTPHLCETRILEQYLKYTFITTSIEKSTTKKPHNKVKVTSLWHWQRWTICTHDKTTLWFYHITRTKDSPKGYNTLEIPSPNFAYYISQLLLLPWHRRYFINFIPLTCWRGRGRLRE